MSDADRFWQRVAKGPPSRCWPWTGATTEKGYGRLKWNGRAVSAHRIAYELAVGEIPKGNSYHGVVVRHTCDNRLCCNPAHLQLGTQLENMGDAVTRGRTTTAFSLDKIAAICADPRSQRQVAADYGVSSSTISNVRSKGRRLGFPAPPGQETGSAKSRR